MGDDNRHEMMESLFGAESGGSDDEPDNKSSYSNDSNATNSGRDDEEGEGEGGGEVEVESDLDGVESERAGSDGGRDVESEAERGGVSDRDEVSDREVEEAEPDVESEAERGGASDRDEASDREIEEVEGSVSGSETSHRGGAVEYDDHEADLAREPSEQGDDELGDEPENEQIDDEQGENEHGDDEQGENEHGDDEQVEDEPIEDEQVEDELGEDEQGENEQVVEEQDDDEQQASGGVAVARDVFGDSDEDDEEVVRRRSLSREASPLASPERLQSEEERSDQEGELPDEFVGDEGRYDSEDDRQAERKREKPVGPPLEIEVPLKPPPGRADQLNLVRVSNIMGIESKPFDPKTYEEESTFVTDADGRKQRIRLEENVARWRIARNRDGSTSYESNARFVKWSDGSMQLLLGNEVLDLSVQDSRHDQSHLFIRHPKSLLQSQGRLLHKMKFMPSSLTSKSHKLLTALVDSRNKKVLKVKSVVTNIDPDKEKEGQEKAVEQRIRSKSDLQRKQDKISRKYSHMPSSGRDTELSSGYLEGALEEEEEADDYDRGSRRHMDQRRFQQQLDAEKGAERRIMNAKRQPPPSRRPPVSKRPAPSRRESMRDVLEDEEEESAYETDPEGDEEEEMDDEDRAFIDEDEEEEPRRYSDKGRVKDRGERRQIDRDDEDKKRRRLDPSPEPELSPPRKSTQRRRVVVSESDEDD